MMGQLALLVADEIKEVAWLAPRFDQLLRFYDSWEGGQHVFRLGCWCGGMMYEAIGNDNDPTTFLGGLSSLRRICC